MGGLNRLIVVVFAFAWLAVLGLALWLVWDQSRFVEVNDGGIEFLFDVTLARAEQILASIILGALALPPLAMLLMQLKRSRPRHIDQPAENDRLAQLQAQIDSLERRLGREDAADRPTEANVNDHRDEPAKEPTPHRRRLLSLNRR